MIAIHCGRKEPPDTSYKMTLRYLRAGMTDDENIIALAKEATSEMSSAAECRFCHMKLPVICKDGVVHIAEHKIRSKYLYDHLEGCTEAFIFAATLGMSSERIIKAADSFSSAKALALDAAGSAIVEDLCDEVNSELEKIANSEGNITLKRYSPGYGDFSIENQKLFSELLNTPKSIGAYLTEGLMMSPSKTVTAIIGIKDRK